MSALAAGLAGLAVALLARPERAGAGGLRRLSPEAASGARALRPSALVLPTAVLGLVLGGPAVGLTLLAAGLGLPRVLERRQAAVRVLQERRRALEALSLLAAELRAGRPPAAALDGAARIAVDGSRAVLAAAAGAARTGGDVPAALLLPGSAVPGTWRSLATCWAVCGGAGYGLAAGVERLEGGLRAAEEQRRAVDAELAGPRATAAMLAVLPVAGVGLAAGLGADPLHVLLHTPLGLACLVLGLAADLLGWWWTHALVRRALAP